MPSDTTPQPDRVRIDQWLWAARFFRTRSLAKAAVTGGKVHLNDQRTKPAKELTVGDRVTIQKQAVATTVVVESLSNRRGSATVAAELYRETPESVERRESWRAQRRMERAGLVVPKRKPNKRERRELTDLKKQTSQD